MNAHERAFAETLGAGYAFSFWKGRVALYAILKALGVGQGDEVILPGYTCVMNVNPICYLGAKPVYVDIEPATYNLDPARIEERLTPKTRVIIAQHTYGYPAAMEEISAVAHRHGTVVIEDCCLAYGSKYKGQVVSSLGAAGYFSSQWNKPYTTGLGGMMVTSDHQLAAKVADLRRQGLIKPSLKETALLAAELAAYRTLVYPRTTALAANLFRWLTKKGLVVGSSQTGEYVPRMADDFFKGMSRVQTRAGLRQVRRTEGMTAHRRRMAQLYRELLAARGWPDPPIPPHLDPVLVRYPVRVADKQRALAEAPYHFVELGSWFECPLHPIETPLRAYDYEPGMCPVAEQACREVVNLPMHPRADRATAQRSVEFITRIGPADGQN